LIREALKLDKEIQELARGLYQQKSLIVMGRGFNYATCLEGALVCDKPLMKEFPSPPIMLQLFYGSVSSRRSVVNTKSQITDEFAQTNDVLYEGNI